jgi:peptidoglycan hydrolase-like protein with peptidoglycan-binding domain
MSTTIGKEQYANDNHPYERGSDYRHRRQDEGGQTHRAHRTTRRRIGVAFALGAVGAALILGSAWLAFGTDHSANSATPRAPSKAPTSHTVIAHPTYQRGQWVASLQHQLGLLNYYNGRDDGVLGPQTHQAIINFQKANGLTPDGVAGPATMALIAHQLTTGDNQMGPSGPPVKPTTGTSTTGNPTTTPTGGVPTNGGSNATTTTATGSTAAQSS